MSSATSSAAPSQQPFAIGQRVSVNRRLGYLRYIGNPPFAPGLWCGIELDDAVGKNDGSVQGKKYFQCKPKHGVFVKAEQVKAEGPPPGAEGGDGDAAAPAAAAAASSSSSTSILEKQTQAQAQAQVSKAAAASGALNKAKVAADTVLAAATAKAKAPAAGSPKVSPAAATGVPVTESDEWKALRKKYDDLKRVAQQYRNQNDELKQALKDHAAAGATHRENAVSATETADLATAEAEVAKLEAELNQARADELQLQIQAIKDADAELKMSSRDSRQVYEEALQVMSKELEKRDREVEQKDKQVEQQTEELRDFRELSQLAAQMEQSDVALGAAKSEMVAVLETQLQEKDAALLQIQEAVTEMQAELDGAYKVNGEYEEKLGDMEKQLKDHLHVVEKGKEEGVKISLGADLLSVYSRAYRQQLEVFRSCLPEAVKDHAGPLGIIGYGLIARLSGEIADFLLDLPEEYDCEPIWFIQVDLRGVQYSLGTVLRRLLSGASAEKVDATISQVPLDIDELETFSHNMISALEHPDGVLPGSLQTQVRAFAAKYAALANQVSDDAASNAYAKGSSASGGGGGSRGAAAGAKQRRRDRALTCALLQQAYAFARVARLQAADVGGLSELRQMLESSKKRWKNPATSTGGVPSGVLSAGGGAELPVAATLSERDRLLRGLTALDSWLRSENNNRPDRANKLEVAAADTISALRGVLAGGGGGGSTSSNFPPAQEDAPPVVGAPEQDSTPALAPEELLSIDEELRSWIVVGTQQLRDRIDRIVQLEPRAQEQAAKVDELEQQKSAFKGQVDDLTQKLADLDRRAAEFQARVEVGEAARTEVVQLRKTVALSEHRASELISASEKIHDENRRNEKAKQKALKQYQEQEHMLEKLRREQKSSAAREITSLRQLCAKYRRELYADRIYGCIGDLGLGAGGAPTTSSSALGTIGMDQSAAQGAAGIISNQDGSSAGVTAAASSNKESSSAMDVEQATTAELESLTGARAPGTRSLLQLAKTRLVDLARPAEWIEVQNRGVVDSSGSGGGSAAAGAGGAGTSGGGVVGEPAMVITTDGGHDDVKLVASMGELMQIRKELLSLRR